MIPTLLDPMEEDILQVVKYCTDLIDDKDLEKLDLIIKYMKRWALLHRLALHALFTDLLYSVSPFDPFSLQAHAAVGGVCLEHGFRLYPGQRAGGFAADLRQHLEDSMKKAAFCFHCVKT